MDPDGEFGFVGAIIGAVAEGLMEAGSQLASGGITDLGAIGEAALEGAILGAVPVVGVTGSYIVLTSIIFIVESEFTSASNE